MTHDQQQLTEQARAGIRRVSWPAVAVGATGASMIGLVAAAGLAPLLASIGLGTLSQGVLTQWLLGLGGNVLAGWVGDLTLSRHAETPRLASGLVASSCCFRLI